MAVLHRAYTIDTKEFIRTLEATIISQDKVLLSTFRQFAIQAAEIPSPEMQEALTWMRFDVEDWLSEDDHGAGYYFLTLLAGRLSAAPALSSRETIESYFQGLYYALQKARWHENDIHRLIHGNSLKEMLRSYSPSLAKILSEQPSFESAILQSGVGWLSSTDANEYYERLKLSQPFFNKIPSIQQMYHRLRWGIHLNSLPPDEVYERTIQMLEASINSKDDLILIID